MRLASVRNKLATALRQTRAGTEEYGRLMGAFLDLDEVEGEAIQRVHERWTAEGNASCLRFLERSPSGRLKQGYRRGRLPPGLAYQESVGPGESQ
jgi:hypothetical protein